MRIIIHTTLQEAHQIWRRYTQQQQLSNFESLCSPNASHHTSAQSVKQPFSKRPRIGFQDQLLLNASQKYCRILQGEHWSILQYFWPSLSYHLSFLLYIVMILAVGPVMAAILYIRMEWFWPSWIVILLWSLPSSLGSIQHMVYELSFKEFGFQDQLLLHAGQKLRRMLQAEHSAILLTII